jgi:hypothetical protein
VCSTFLVISSVLPQDRTECDAATIAAANVRLVRPVDQGAIHSVKLRVQIRFSRHEEALVMFAFNLPTRLLSLPSNT